MLYKSCFGAGSSFYISHRFVECPPLEESLELRKSIGSGDFFGFTDLHCLSIHLRLTDLLDFSDVPATQNATNNVRLPFLLKKATITKTMTFESIFGLNSRCYT